MIDLEPRQTRTCYFHSRSYNLCFRWNCNRFDCRQAIFHVTKSRFVKGANQWMTKKRILFVSCYHINAEAAQQWGALQNLKDKFRKLLRAIKRLASSARETFEYAWTYGRNGSRASTRRGIHTHGLMTWLPDMVSEPTSAHPSRQRSAALERLATRLGLRVWIEEAESSEAVAVYCMKNVLALSGESLPPRFRRVSFSRHWCEWTKENNKEARRSAARIVRSMRMKRMMRNSRTIFTSSL